MPQTALDPVTIRSQYRAPQRIFDQFAAIAATNRELARAVAIDIARLAGVEVQAAAVPGAHSANLERVTRALLAAGNRPMRKEELAQAAGISVQSVVGLLYRTAPESFERLPVPQGGRAVAFRLRPAIAATGGHAVAT